MEEHANSRIDLSYLELIFNGNNEVIKKVLQRFIDKTPTLLVQLDKEAMDHNWTEVNMIAHKIKSSFNTIGAKSIGTFLAKIELDSLENNKSSVQLLINQIKEPSSEVFKQIELKLAL